ncbi:MAG TPA: hypothetical protein VMF06_18725 [Candidatus Limnocylindria bacterium]|jgi:hypothetical protein|nr:hypothetical protein [Candidatus Limnocylindria bacterium]
MTHLFRCALMMGLIYLCCGFHTATIDPVEAFRLEHPNEAKYYVNLYPASFDIYRRIQILNSAQIKSIATTLKSMGKDCPGAAKYGVKLLETQKQVDDSAAVYYRSFEEMTANAAYLFQFEWRKDDKLEVGFLALRDGEIVKREVFSPLAPY